MDGFGQVIVAHCSTLRQQSADFVSCEEEQTIRRRSWIHNDLAKEADHTPGFNPMASAWNATRSNRLHELKPAHIGLPSVALAASLWLHIGMAMDRKQWRQRLGEEEATETP